MTRLSTSHALVVLALGSGVSGCAAPKMKDDVFVATATVAPPIRGAVEAADEAIGTGDVLLVSIADLVRVGETHTMEVRVDPARPASFPVLGCRRRS